MKLRKLFPVLQNKPLLSQTDLAKLPHGLEDRSGSSMSTHLAAGEDAQAAGALVNQKALDELLVM